MAAYIYEHTKNVYIEPTSIFGEDANAILEIAHELFKDALGHRYDNCYHAPKIPFNDRKEAILNGTLKPLLDSWNEQHSEEIERERQEKAIADANYDKLLKKFYGIAKRHRIYIKWHDGSGGGGGACTPDQFEIYKDGNDIGRIHCM